MQTVIVGIIMFVLVLMLLSIVAELVYAILDKRAKKWLRDRHSEISKELSDIGYRYRGDDDEFRFIFHKHDGFYISTQYSSSNVEERTKLMSAMKLRKVLFQMYETPYNQVLEPLFADYENHKKEKQEKANKALFSGNNYKRAVKFKRPDEDK